ncbi:MAG: ABC transporter ATP-binding protein [Inconstantimicrobium porci]|uniref:ABC transporter ATP-binding protein n=1 Tax=Inconstantimicrobium porci TaxID=2652291 RepID=UPI002A91893A|nr:ABC transporter ATP-binding protein [Inconstantimicrobium porci]MDY5910455.1 ABC transporter ATP-binding protein [Inconstantimicrobium porci]
MIKIKNLTKEFERGGISELVLKGIDLTIERGQFVTITGPSGGGKSTLLNIIAMLMEPTSGSVTIDDEEINYKKENHNDDLRRNKIGLIFQNANLISCLSPMENLMVAMDNDKSYKEKKEEAKRLLESVGLKNKIKADVSSLSGGEAQRVAIVRSLVNKPSILLCDEPTGALDSNNGKRVMELLLNIKKKNNATLIIVTHDKRIADMGERRLFLEDGEIRELS